MEEGRPQEVVIEERHGFKKETNKKIILERIFLFRKKKQKDGNPIFFFRKKETKIAPQKITPSNPIIPIRKPSHNDSTSRPNSKAN